LKTLGRNAKTPIGGDMSTVTYRVKKAIGGYAVSYDCPHCATAITSSLNEAGTSRPCPACTKPLLVPGKANLDRLRAKEEADRRVKAGQARQQQLPKEEQPNQQAEVESVQAPQRHDAEAEVTSEESKHEAFWKTHCRYCYEEIKENAKKCKNCCEYLDKELRAQATEQDVVRFRPPFNDVFWLVVKFWAVSFLFAFAGFLLFLIFGAVTAAMR
jgi:hypothetical protein